MTSLILEVYDAFKSVGIDDEMARKAAGALSEHQRQTDDLGRDLHDQIGELRSEIKQQVADLRAEMNQRFVESDAKMNQRFADLRTEQVVVRTILAILLAGVASLVLKAFF